jgi:surface protein
MPCKNDNMYCTCDKGYHNDPNNNLHCLTDEPDASGICNYIDCGGHGVCQERANSAYCQCDQNYRPDTTQLNCIPVCEGITCGDHGKCDGTTGAAVCTCDTGFHTTTDKPLECVAIPDNNHNYMQDHFETATDQGTDCRAKADRHTCSDFCDSFIDYKCSTKCTSDEQCISDDYFCRSDGRCAPKVFETVWTVPNPNMEIRFPGGSGTDCNYTIDWGDKSEPESFTECAEIRKHTYVEQGDYSIKVTGTINGWRCMINYPKTAGAYDSLCAVYIFSEEGASEPGVYLVKVNSFGPVMLEDAAFAGANVLSTISTIDIPNGQMTNADYMFYDVLELNDSISLWDTSNIKSMKHTFANALEFNQPLNGWDTSNVTDMGSMFDDAYSFNQPLDNWDTSNVTNMGYMFSGANRFNGSLNGWNTTKVTNMDGMFDDAREFDQPLDHFDTSNVTSMVRMFHAAFNFNRSLNNWNTSNVKNMSGMFSSTSFNQPLDNWDTSNVTDMHDMFRSSAFNQPLNTDGNKWNTSNVTDMSGMFYSAKNFNKSLDTWNTSKVTNMEAMFHSAIKFNQSLEDWDTSNVTNMYQMFYMAESFNQPLNTEENKWDTSNVTNMDSMFEGADRFNQNLSTWDVSKVRTSGQYNMMLKLTALSKENWENMVRDNDNWAEMDKSKLGITY